jgi:hypothetical protein
VSLVDAAFWIDDFETLNSTRRDGRSFSTGFRQIALFLANLFPVFRQSRTLFVDHHAAAWHAL